MKNLIVGILLFSFIQGCSENDNPTKFTLTVTNGSGSGEYLSGQVVQVAANITPDGQVFNGWTGDVSTISNVQDTITNLTMPANDISIEATYVDIDLGVPVAITVDPTVTFQTIDGFGFFGSQDVWWGSSANMWSDAWGEKVISDLGLTIWRNEYFPPSTPDANQDADWNKQQPVVAGLKAKAEKYNVDLKFIFTVWSPPAALKWQSTFTWPGDENATRMAGDVSTKNGGTLNPNKYTEYADWLKAGIQLYKDEGIDVYAISMQNEPMFTQTFNSCTYTFDWYNDLLINVAPKIKQTFPDVRIFGSEHMLDMEGADENWPYFYHSHIKANADASENVDILAVHGYQDGVAPSSGSGLAERWTNHLEQFSQPMNKRTWMTETSGYSDAWSGSGDTPGAFGLAQDIYAGLYYGNISAWVWWQGSQLDAIGEYNLMKGLTTGKKYAVSKQYYRYIRPGAVRIKATASENIFATAYTHNANGTLTLVIINGGDTPKQIYVTGTGLPATFEMFRTTAGADNCALISTVQSGADHAFTIPAKSIITLQAGGSPL